MQIACGTGLDGPAHHDKASVVRACGAISSNGRRPASDFGACLRPAGGDGPSRRRPAVVIRRNDSFRRPVSGPAPFMPVAWS